MVKYFSIMGHRYFFEVVTNTLNKEYRAWKHLINGWLGEHLNCKISL